MKKMILFTGGSGKLGKRYLKYASEEGIDILTTIRDKERFVRENEFLLRDGNIHIIEVDFTNANASSRIIAYLKENCYSLSTIIHNARSLDYLKIENDGTVSADNFAKEFFLDVIFPYRLTMELVDCHPELKNIIFISSIYGLVAPNPSLYEEFEKSSPINYGVSKAAQIHLTRELAVRLAPKQIRVNCISYGGVSGREDQEFKKKYIKLCPQGQMLSDDDIVAPLNFLISDGSKNMTGHNLIVDGGWSVW